MGVDAQVAAPVHAPMKNFPGESVGLPPAGHPVDGAIGPVAQPGPVDLTVGGVLAGEEGEHRLHPALPLQHIKIPLCHVPPDHRRVGIFVSPLGGVARLTHKAAGNGIDVCDVLPIGLLCPSDHSIRLLSSLAISFSPL